MKYVVITIILLLTAGAFVPLMVDDNTGLTAALHGDDRLQLMWGVVDLAVVAVCLVHSRQFIRVASRQPLLVALVLWAIASTAWSGDPALTGRRSLGLLCTVALGFFFGMRFELKELMRIVAWSLAIAVLASLVAGVLFPSFAIMSGLDGGAWRGVFIHKNTMARVIGLAVILYTCLASEPGANSLVQLICLFFSIVLLALSKSATAIIVTFLTLCLWLCLKLRLRPVQSIAIFAVGLLFGLGATLLLQGHTDLIFGLMSRDVTLSGRTQLWSYAFAAVLQRPLLGAGWDSFWMGPDGDTIRSQVGWFAAHAHDAFLDLALTIGVVGLGIFLVGFFDCLRRAWQYSRDPDNPLSLWPVLFYSFLFFYMFTEASTVDRHSFFNIIYCAISVSLTERVRLQALEREQEEEYMPSVVAPDSTMIREFQ